MPRSGGGPSTGVAEASGEADDSPLALTAVTT